MNIKKKAISFSIDENTLENLKQLAEKENRSVSNLIRRILKKHLENDYCDN